MADVEKLTLVLEAKLNEFNASLNKAAATVKDASSKMEKSTSGMASVVEGAVGSFGKFATAAGIVAGATALGAVVRSALNTADSIGDLSGRLGVSTKFLQEMQYTATQMDTSQETLNNSLVYFNRVLGQAAIGEETAAKAFNRLGISVTDTNGKTKTVEQTFTEVIQKMDGVKDASARAAVAQELFGRSGQQMANFMIAGSKEVQRLRNEANELGVVLSDRVIQNADQANNKLEALAHIIKIQTVAALVEAAPAITTVVSAMISLTSWTAKAVRGWSEFWGAPKTNAEQIEAIDQKLNNLHATVKKLNAEPVGFAPRKADFTVQAETKQIEAQIAVLEAQKQAILGKEKAAQDAARQTSGTVISLDDERRKRQEEADAKAVERTKKELDDHFAKIEAMRALEDEKYNADIERETGRINALMGLQDQHSKSYLDAKAKLKKFDDADAAATKKRDQEVAQARASSLNWISGLQYSKSKEAAAVGKTAAVINTTIATKEAAVQAYKAMVGIPIVGPALAVAASAAAVAAGMAQVASITGTNIGFQTGVDSVPGIGRGDRVPAMLEPGERVVRTETNKVLEQFLRDYQAGAPTGGSVVVELRLTDGLMDMIETKLVERGRVNVSITAA